MKRLFLLILFAGALWFAWKNGPEAFQKKPGHWVEVTNDGKAEMQRLRVAVGGQTFVAETLAQGAVARWRFRTTEDTRFDLVWEWGGGRGGEMRWSGGRVARGPLVQRHRLRVLDDGGVVSMTEELPAEDRKSSP